MEKEAGSLGEQEAIVSFLNDVTAAIEKPVCKIEESIARLREYHTVLISAAVTGKIDVREVVA